MFKFFEWYPKYILQNLILHCSNLKFQSESWYLPHKKQVDSFIIVLIRSIVQRSEPYEKIS